MNYPNHFQLYNYNEAIIHSEVINVGELQDSIWLKLPDDMAKYLTLTGVSSIGFENNGTSIDITGKVTRVTNRIWIEIDKSVFSFDTGFHMYQLVFDDSGTGSILNLYFCYHIQDNRPDKDYIYMNREES